MLETGLLLRWYFQFGSDLELVMFYDRFKVPVFLMGGWYDYYAGEITINFMGLRKRAPSHELRNSHRICQGYGLYSEADRGGTPYIAPAMSNRIADYMKMRFKYMEQPPDTCILVMFTRNNPNYQIRNERSNGRR